jgi:hypothetical protein
MAGRRGLGSIRKLPSGKYQVRYTDPLGIRRTARTTFQTKSLAEFELTRIRGAIESGTWHIDQTPQAGDLDPKTLTLKELAAHWRSQQVTSKGFPLSPNTLGEYQRLIERVLVGFANQPIRQITRQQKTEIRTLVGAMSGSENLTCTGFRLASQSQSQNVLVKTRARLACDFAKTLNPALTVSVETKITTSASSNGRVIIASR